MDRQKEKQSGKQIRQLKEDRKPGRQDNRKGKRKKGKDTNNISSQQKRKAVNKEHNGTNLRL